MLTTKPDLHVHLLARWRATRHPRIGDLCERVAAARLAETPLPPLAASKKRADLAAWDAVEAQREPLDFARLAASARGGTQEQVIAHVKALAQRDDPALAMAMLALLEDPPYAGVVSRPMLALILDTIRASGDRRAAAAARDLAQRYLAIVSSGTGGWVSQRLAALADELEAIPPRELAADDAALCDELEAVYGKREVTAAPAGAKTLAQLLDEVYASPADDGPRQIYADALLERGDPRGEWIALDLARARGAIDAAGEARLRELADDGQIAAWAYPLSNGADVAFERGFPARLRLYRNAKDIVGARELATVHTITGVDVVTQKTLHALLANPHAGFITRVGPFPTVSALAKCCQVPRPWTAVTFTCKDLPADLFANLPALTELDVHVEVGAKLPPDAFALPDLRALTLRWRQCHRIVLPPRLEKLVLYMDKPPALGLEDQPALRELAIDFHEGPATLALPPTVTRLRLSSRFVQGLPLVTPLPALEHADLSGNRVTEAHLAALASARTMSLSLEASLPPAALAPFARLVDLTVRAPVAEPPVLPPSLTRLRWTALGVAHVAAPRLEAAALAFAGAPEQLAAFLARSPQLRSLELDARYGDDLDLAAIGAWAPHLRDSQLAAFTLVFQPKVWGARDRVELTRTAEGWTAASEPADPIGKALVAQLCG